MTEGQPFTIAAVPGVTPTKWTRAWEQRRPEWPLAVTRTAQAAQLDDVRAGHADIAFVRLPIDDDASLSVIPLYDEQPMVVVSQDHVIAALDSVTIADLADESHIGGDWAEAVEVVAAGAGVVVMPQSVARLHSRRDVVAKPVMDATATRIALAWVSARTTDRVEEFVGIVRGRTAASSRATAPEAGPTIAVDSRKPKKGATGKGVAGSGAAGRGEKKRAPQSAADARRQANLRKRRMR
ncbi:substrate-binding domain-containing protein [Marisediminicola senii]|uniref:substrate-binding domain-containing protein n=1 Tax=Marisediminicola senii TaxID=2711233 RepID=UPI0013EA3E44|nr:substrate-binding domain-containing protein [Marisediminicola senii]